MTMDDSSSSDLQSDNSSPYEAMALAVRNEIMELLFAFQQFSPELRSGSTKFAGFIQEFVSHAERFHNSCSEECAKIGRRASVLPEILAVPTVSLAKEIRAAVFEEVDHKLEVITQFQAKIDDHRMFCESHELDALTEAQGASLLKQSRAVMIQNIGEYLQSVNELPENILDYCCAKCFGDRVSLQRQQQALELVQAAIATEVERAIQIISAASKTQGDLESKSSSGAEAKVEAREIRVKRREPGAGISLIILSIFLTLWAFRSCDPGTNTEGEMLLAVALCVCAFFALTVGLNKLLSGKHKAS